MINHFASQSQTCQHLNFFNTLKLWKVVQSKVELMRINFKFESPIIQVQIITYIIELSKEIEIYRVGDNRGTVNTLTSPHISDQLGTEYACLTLLCWFIVIWYAIICIDMNVISDLSTAINNFWYGFDRDKCVNLSTPTALRILFIEI